MAVRARVRCACGRWLRAESRRLPWQALAESGIAVCSPIVRVFSHVTHAVCMIRSAPVLIANVSPDPAQTAARLSHVSVGGLRPAMLARIGSIPHERTFGSFMLLMAHAIMLMSRLRPQRAPHSGQA